MNLCSIIAVLVALKCVENAKILAIFPLPGRSHVNLLSSLVKPLLERGHEVDVVSHFPLKIQSPKLKELSLQDVKHLNSNVTVRRSYSNDYINVQMTISAIGNTLTERLLQSKTTKELKNSSTKYDLLLLHIFLTDAMYGFAHTFNIPIVGVITSVNLPWTSDIIGLPDNPSYIPNYFAPFGQKMTFYERFKNTVYYIYVKIIYAQHDKGVNKIFKNFFGTKIPKIEDLKKRVSLILSNSHFSVNIARPIVPNFVEIGGLHIDGNVSLPKNLEDLLNSETKDVIYLSFGSIFKSENFYPEVLQAIFDSFSELPYKILWKGNKEEFERYQIPANVHFESWMPQLGVLCHPKTKLFISHGGLFSTQEAVYCGVPILGVPIVADQASNVKTVQDKGMALLVNYEEITKELFLKTIKILLNKKYKDNAEKLSKQFKDRPLSPVETAMYWIEYVIKYGDASQLKSMAANLSWYQYYLVDVMAAVFVLLFVVSYLMYKAVLKARNMLPMKWFRRLYVLYLKCDNSSPEDLNKKKGD